MTTNDGGSAFPCPESEGWAREHGMSLRDWFAGQALVGLLRTRENFGIHYTEQTTPMASVAYAFADAMLKERSK